MMRHQHLLPTTAYSARPVGKGLYHQKVGVLQPEIQGHLDHHSHGIQHIHVHRFLPQPLLGDDNAFGVDLSDEVYWSWNICAEMRCRGCLQDV